MDIYNLRHVVAAVHPPDILVAEAYRSVAAGLIDAVQDNCSRGAFENLEGAGRLSENLTNLIFLCWFLYTVNLRLFIIVVS